MSNLSRTLLATALIFTAGSATSAMAGGRHVSVNVGSYFSGNFGHKYHHGHRNIVVNVGGGRDCGYYYDRWQDTGKRHWKNKYYDCKGW